MRGQRGWASDRPRAGAPVGPVGVPDQAPNPKDEATAREALSAAVARLDQAERAGCPHELTVAQAGVGSCYRAIGALTAAEETLRQALRAARKTGSTQLLVEVLCQLAETACTIAEQRAASDAPGARAACDRARDQVFEASSLVYRSLDTAWAANALLRIGEVLIRCGDHEDAAVLQARATQHLGRS